MYLYKRQFRFKDTHWLKVKGWEKIYHANKNSNRAGEDIIRSRKKIDFRRKKNHTRDKNKHLTILKGSILKEDITIKKTYTVNKIPPKYMKPN